MTAVLLDTHAWAWLLTNDARLSRAAREASTSADTVWLSSISFYEIAQKYRLGKWPEMASYVDAMGEYLEKQGGVVVEVSGSIASSAGSLGGSSLNRVGKG